MNKYLKSTLIILLYATMFGSAIVLYLYNSTSLSTQTCLDCTELSATEELISATARYILSICSIIAVMYYWTRELTRD